MADICTNNPNMSEIKASLNHILHSLTELSTRINKPPRTSSPQLINTPAPLSLPIPSNPTTPFPLVPSNPTLPLSYPVKHLTYSEMQQLHAQGLCLNCNDIDTPSHPGPVKRILLVLPDEDPNIEHQSIGKHAPTDPEQLTHASDPKVMRLELLEPADLKAPQFQSAVLNSSVARQMDMGITHHSLHIKAAHNLDFPIDKSSSLSMAAGSGNSIMSNGLYSYMDRNFYLTSMSDWIVGKIMMVESRVLVFDPGGTFNKKNIFDLEDKVDLEGVGNDMHTTSPAAHEASTNNNARPRRVIHRPRRFLDR